MVPTFMEVIVPGIFVTNTLEVVSEVSSNGSSEHKSSADPEWAYNMQHVTL